MTDDLPTLSISAHSVLYMALNQICTVCQDVSPELRIESERFDLSKDTSSKNHRITTELLTDYLYK